MGLLGKISRVLKIKSEIYKKNLKSIDRCKGHFS